VCQVKPDSGEVAIRKRTRLSYVKQISDFAENQTIRSVIGDAFETRFPKGIEQAVRPRH